MNAFMHGLSFFSFHFFSFSISLPKLTIFTILHLYMACRGGKSLRSLERLKTGRKIPYLRFPRVLPVLYSLYNWIGEHEITKLKKIFASNPEKRTQNKHKKT